MGFLKWAWKKKKQIAVVILAIASIVAFKKIFTNAVKEHNISKKDPIVKMVRDSTDKYQDILLNAHDASQSDNLNGVKKAIQMLDKENERLGGALYDNSDLDYLVGKGWLSGQQIEEAKKFRMRIGDIRTALAKRQQELEMYK